MRRQSKTLVSIVSPSYNESANIPQMVKEVEVVFSKLSDKYDYEYIFVNDGSTDNTWDMIRRLGANNSKIKGLNFSRNFGHQMAVTAGLRQARGDVVIYCDSDLQHPPKVFIDMLKKWEEGYKIVHTIRKDTEGISFLKRITSVLFYKVINLLSDINLEQGMADFKLLDKEVLDRLNNMQEHNRFLRGMVAWLGHESARVTYVARRRVHGKPWYTFRRSLTFAKTGILSLSVKPLKYIGYTGLFITFSSILFLFLALLVFLVTGVWYLSPVFTLLLVNSFFIGIVLVSLGIIALYVSYVYYETTNRPLYIVTNTVNVE